MSKSSLPEEPKTGRVAHVIGTSLSIWWATEPVCTHCCVPVPPNEAQVEGLCRRCVEEEGPPVDDALERARVMACRALGGLRAIVKPCLDGIQIDPAIADVMRDQGQEPPVTRCETCRAIWLRRKGAPVGRHYKPHPKAFLFEDAQMLRRYYSKESVGGIGARRGTADATEERYGPPAEFRSQERPQRTESRCPVCVAVARAKRLAAAQPPQESSSVLDPDPYPTFKTGYEITDAARAAAERGEAIDVLAGLAKLREDQEPIARTLALRDIAARHSAQDLGWYLERMALPEDERRRVDAMLVDSRRIVQVTELAHSETAEAFSEVGEAHLDAILHEDTVGFDDDDTNYLTPHHRHTKAELALFQPVRFYDQEVTVDGKPQLVQVAVYPPSLEPLSYDSQYITAKGTSNEAGKAGHWDDEAVSHVSSRTTDAMVARVLARMAQHHRDVLEAYYASTEELSVRQGQDDPLGAYAEVATYTDAAQKLKRELVEFSATSAIEHLRRRAAGGDEREGAIERLRAMRKQAEALVLEAEVAYGDAAAGLPMVMDREERRAAAKKEGQTT